MEELIVDDIPIFTRVHKKCLLFCSISVLQKYAKGLCLVNWFAAILKISKMRSVAMQTKCKPKLTSCSSCGTTIHIYDICPLA